LRESQPITGFFATAFVKSEKAIALLAAEEDGHLLFAQHSSAGKDMMRFLSRSWKKQEGRAAERAISLAAAE